MLLSSMLFRCTQGSQGSVAHLIPAILEPHKHNSPSRVGRFLRFMRADQLPPTEAALAALREPFSLVAEILEAERSRFVVQLTTLSACLNLVFTAQRYAGLPVALRVYDPLF